MRAIQIFALILVTSIIYSCKQEIVVLPDCSTETLLAGDTSLSETVYIRLDTLITSETRGDSAYFFIHVDSAGSHEIEFIAFVDYGLTFYNIKYFIKTVDDHTQLLLNDSLDSPEILELHDSIDLYQHAHHGRFILASCYGSQSPSTGEEWHSRWGYWLGVDQKYIGFVYGDGAYNYSGWIKIGLEYTEGSWGPRGIYLYDYAFLKCCL